MKYFIKNTLKYSLIFSILILVSCSDSGVDNHAPATVKGRVDGDNTRQKVTSVEGATVTMGTIQSDGTISTINNVEAETSADGSFQLNFDPTIANRFIITATKDANKWRGYINSEVESGSELIIKPINNESSAEADVFAQLVASGHADEVLRSDIESAINSDAAVEINSTASTAAHFATAIYNSAKARAEFFANEVEGDAMAKLAAVKSAMLSAQASFESNLHSSTSLEAYNTAYEAYLDARLNAYTSAGVKIERAAKSIEMESRLLLNSLKNTSVAARNAARAQTSLFVAMATDAAIQAQAEASGMSQSTKNQIAQAGVKLKSDIRAALGVKSEVEAAFETYKEEVKTALENDGSVEASVIADIDASINANAGSKAVFESAISTVTDASVAIDIYNTFFSTVRSTVESEFDAGTSDSKIEAVYEMMLLINLYS